MSTINRQLQLASRPQGEPSAANFKLVEAPLAPLADGQVLVKHHYLSLDPYMRGRMSDAKSYATPQPLDQVMIGGTAGEVVESRNPHFQAGDKVVGMGGWQEYAVVDFGQRTSAACCRRSIPPTCRCRPTSAPSACPASPAGTAS